MDPIPSWVRRLWDMWDIRVLVLLSFTLQIILCIFGSRRKYISSLWISVLVWSAYLMADWVATVALGKLSDVQNDPEKSNILWAMWAPLLLLHLGGPDGISAYSLEDNQLWMRHLLGLVVQLFVAIYVILLSWKNSWFTFMSIPALVAGIIKYGERTWVLKSVSDNNFKDILPFGDLGDKYTTMGHEYTGVLILAHCYIEEFKIYLGGEGRQYEDVRHFEHVNIGESILWDAVEVSMGLMYDLLYTKASKVYSKGGCILRCISFGCTVIVSVGLIFRIVLLKTREHEIDVAITGVLVLGALALEIYAAIVICSSNWGMLWLIKQGRGEWVIWLSQRFPWLFNKKKNWSRTMGQFDFLRYCLKVREPTDVQKPIRKIIRSVLGRDYEDEWNKYRNKSTYSVHLSAYNAILDFYKGRRSSRISDLMTESEWTAFRLIFEYLRRPFKGKFFCLHLATEICYHLEIEWNDDGEDLSEFDSSSLWKQNREVCKALSDYIMYLLVMQPSLLPDDGSSRLLEKALHDLEYDLLGHARDKIGACHYLLETYGGLWSMLAHDLKGKGKVKRWEILKLMWWGFLRGTRATSSNGHFQQLKQGGEFLTFMLFCNFMSNIFMNSEMLECGPSAQPWVATPMY